MATSYVQYSGTGAQTNFSVTFPYLDADHVEVRVDGVVPTFSWINSTTIQITPAPTNGAVVDLRRNTPSLTPDVDFTDGSIVTEEQLDRNAKQALFVSQEAEDGANDALSRNNLGVWDAEGDRLTNVADPVDDEDVPNLGYVTALTAGSVAAAASSASAAAASASAALASENAADASATAADASATAAAASENAAAASASAAASSASAASASASSASTSASTATTKAGEAATSASNASTSASTATTEASEAATSASSAATSASNAAGSADDALQSKLDAQAAAASAALAFDSFDDRYLGPKDTAPAVDNDGNALVSGALYYDTVIALMRQWNGTNWVSISPGMTETDADLRYVHADGSLSMTGALTLPNSDPSNDNHAARKKYVDDLIANGNGKGARTVSASAASGGGTDGDLWYQV